jgi:hypothetical protein
MSDRFGIAGKLYRRRRRYGGCRIASSSQAITAAAGIPNVSPGASLPIGMPPAVVFDLVGQSAAAATAALRALLAPFNWPLLRMPTPISGGIPSAIQSASHSPTDTASRSGSAKV